MHLLTIHQLVKPRRTLHKPVPRHALQLQKQNPRIINMLQQVIARHKIKGSIPERQMTAIAKNKRLPPGSKRFHAPVWNRLQTQITQNVSLRKRLSPTRHIKTEQSLTLLQARNLIIPFLPKLEAIQL
jgi:hypothetical protein